ncbi:MAG: PRC-barrel domain-containing protein [Candidatus Dormibacteraceae bacterium]
MVEVGNLADWRGKDLIDRDGDKIGKLEDVYVDTETDEPVFGSVKEGRIGKHLTFVPLATATVSPNTVQVAVSREQVKDAPNIDQDGELTADAESELYRYYEIVYRPPQTGSGRRLAKR